MPPPTPPPAAAHEEMSGARRAAALALLAFEGFLLAPLLVWAAPAALRLFWGRGVHADVLPTLVTMALAGWGVSGVVFSCARHAWETLKGRREPEPLHWYAALIVLTLFASVLWGAVLLFTKVSVY